MGGTDSSSWTLFGKLGGETDVEHEGASVSARFERALGKD